MAVFCIGMTAGEILSADAIGQSPVQMQRLIINLNSHWLFKPGDVVNGQADTLNETGFLAVCLPHANASVPHRDINMKSFRNVSWYRRHFRPSVKYRGRRFVLKFQGASQVTDVFVNGRRVGEHLGAYTLFSFDITDLVRFGEDNVIAIRVDVRWHRQIPPEGIIIDFMLFGVITRDISMNITAPLHLEWVFASRDSVDPNRVNVRIRIRNNGPVGRRCLVGSQIIDSAGTIVATGASTRLKTAEPPFLSKPEQMKPVRLYVERRVKDLKPPVLT